MAKADDTKLTPAAAALRGNIIIDTYRGQVRIRSWPKPRGKAKSAAQQVAQDLFYWRARVAKHADERQMHFARTITPGSGWMPRDVIMSLMAGRFFSRIVTEQGVIYSMSFIAQVSEALDAITQQPGTLLWRSEDRWHPIPPGTPGNVLTYQGTEDPPEWLPPSGGGGDATAWETLTEFFLSEDVTSANPQEMFFPNGAQALRLTVERSFPGNSITPATLFNQLPAASHRHDEGYGTIVRSPWDGDALLHVSGSGNLASRAYRYVLTLHRDNDLNIWHGHSVLIANHGRTAMQPMLLINLPTDPLTEFRIYPYFEGPMEAGHRIKLERDA